MRVFKPEDVGHWFIFTGGRDRSRKLLRILESGRKGMTPDVYDIAADCREHDPNCPACADQREQAEKERDAEIEVWRRAYESACDKLAELYAAVAAQPAPSREMPRPALVWRGDTLWVCGRARATVFVAPASHSVHVWLRGNHWKRISDYLTREGAKSAAEAAVLAQFT